MKMVCYSQVGWCYSIIMSMYYTLWTALQSVLMTSFQARSTSATETDITRRRCCVFALERQPTLGTSRISFPSILRCRC